MSDLQTLLDREALRDLAATYARGVDRIDLELLESIFVPEGEIHVYHGDPAKIEPTYAMTSREQILKGIETISRYQVTTHFVGQQNAEIDGDSARAETYCRAVHTHQSDGPPQNYLMSIRYHDRFERREGRWLFRERVLITDWHQNTAVEALVRR